ncbi:SufS family cysteine desulfurase [Spelaeicoccus albus]|uniref:SufS family cysteine desulfurase n=1 Tax=Spelaeicoccus albus TaxID=1280376 RepID=UPI0015C7BFD4|nr:SufS family cysteine desulfurase [Spelaeicoccus albus]
MSDVSLTPPEVQRIRNDFPVLDERVGSSPLVYLDSGATSQKPVSVLEAEQDFYVRRNAAVHRGAHTLAVAATDAYEGARHRVATFVGADEDEIVWTKNATESLNLVAYALGNPGSPVNLGPGSEIVVTEMEHHANLVPWQQLAARTGAALRYVSLGEDGRLNAEDLDVVLGEKTAVFAFTHASNVLGTINDAADLAARARRVGALSVLDACQSVPHMPVDMHALGVDFAAFSSHKMLGPGGLGALYGTREALASLPPFLTGGSMIRTVTMVGSDFMDPPQRFEAGTQPIAQTVGLSAAADYLDETGMDRIHGWEQHLGARLVDGIQEIPGVRMIGPTEAADRLGLVSFDVDGVHAHDVGQFLDDRGVAVRVGHHCAQPLHRRYGLTATTRASAYLYNTEEEIDVFLGAVADVRRFFVGNVA